MLHMYETGTRGYFVGSENLPLLMASATIVLECEKGHANIAVTFLTFFELKSTLTEAGLMAKEKRSNRNLIEY